MIATQWTNPVASSRELRLDYIREDYSRTNGPDFWNSHGETAVRSRALRLRALALVTTRMKTAPSFGVLELAIAMLEAPPESPETQRVLELLDQGAIRFQDAVDRLRTAQQQARAARCGLSAA